MILIIISILASIILLLSVLNKSREPEKSRYVDCHNFAQLFISRDFSSSRKFCVCGKKLTLTGRSAKVQIYTRKGTFIANHLEKR